MVLHTYVMSLSNGIRTSIDCPKEPIKKVVMDITIYLSRLFIKLIAYNILVRNIRKLSLIKTINLDSSSPFQTMLSWNLLSWY